MLKRLDIEAFVGAAESHQVEGREITRRVVEEHIFRAGIGGVDPAILRAGVPIIDGSVILQPRIGRLPRSFADLIPQIARLDGFRDFSVGAASQVPIAVPQDRFDEIIGNADGIIGILP